MIICCLVESTIRFAHGSARNCLVSSCNHRLDSHLACWLVLWRRSCPKCSRHRDVDGSKDAWSEWKLKEMLKGWRSSVFAVVLKTLKMFLVTIENQCNFLAKLGISECLLARKLQASTFNRHIRTGPGCCGWFLAKHRNLKSSKKSK